MKKKNLLRSVLAGVLLLSSGAVSYAAGCLECVNSSNNGHCYGTTCSVVYAVGDVCCGNHI